MTEFVVLLVYTVVAVYLAIDAIFDSHIDLLDVTVGLLMAAFWPMVVLFILAILANDGIVLLWRKIHKPTEKADITV